MTTRRRFLTLAGGTALGVVAGSRLLRLGATGVQAQPIPGAPTFKGAAGNSQIVGPVSLGAGVTVLRAQHNGTSNFVVHLYVPADGYDPQTAYTMAEFNESFLAYNAIGPTKGAGVALVGVPGDHYLAVTADGEWQIGVEQPLPENIVPVEQTTFTGKGEDVSPYFTLPAGISTLSVATASTALRAWLYHIDDLGGAPVQAGLDVYDGRIFDFTFPDNPTSVALDLPDNGPYLLAVTADVENKDGWTFTFS